MSNKLLSTTLDRQIKSIQAETKAIVEPRLQVSREKLKRISDRSLARYLSAAEIKKAQAEAGRQGVVVNTNK